MTCFLVMPTASAKCAAVSDLVSGFEVDAFAMNPISYVAGKEAGDIPAARLPDWATAARPCASAGSPPC